MSTTLWIVSYWNDNKIEKIPFFKRKNAIEFSEMIVDSVRIWKEVRGK